MSAASRPRWRHRLRQATVLLILGAALGSYFVFDLGDWLTLDRLSEHGQEARRFAAEQPATVIAAFIASLTLVTLLCIPAVAVMQAFSGFLFGPLIGTLISVLAQTLGGALAFLIARSAFRESVAKLIGRYATRLEAGFKANAFTYIVTLRMTPVVPYWVVNVAPSLLGVRFRPFVLGTLVGAIPLTFVYATFGAGLSEVIEAGGTPELKSLLEPKTLALIAAMLCFAFAPLILRRWFAKRVSPPPSPPPEAAETASDREPPR